ncbi:MAG: phosphotransferase [Actinomycetota bacterium]
MDLAATDLVALAVDVVRRRYGLVPTATTVVAAHSFNTVLRIDVDGEASPLALRVGTGPRIHEPGVEDVEAGWLDDLADAGLPVPRNRPASDGARWVGHPTPGEPDGTTAAGPAGRPTLVCTLFGWVDGEPLRDRPTSSGLAAAGAALAGIHQRAAAQPSPADVPRRLRADRAIGFEAGDHLRHLADRPWSTRLPNVWPAVAEAVERTQATIDELWRSPPHDPHLLHGDFGPHNVLVADDGVRVIDFQDLQVGFDLQDVALATDTLTRRHPDLVEPFHRGYASVRPLPDVSPALAAALRTARDLTIANLAMATPGTGITDLLDETLNRIVWPGQR